MRVKISVLPVTYFGLNGGM